MKYREYWNISGNGLTRTRKMKKGTLIEFALAKGFDGNAVGWIFETVKVVKHLRDLGYHVTYERVEDDGSDEL